MNLSVSVCLTVSARHSRPKQEGDYVLISDDYIQPCYNVFVLGPILIRL